MNFYAMTAAEAAEYISRTGFDVRVKNCLRTKKKKSLLQRFFMQFSDFMTIILLIAAAISFFVSVIGEESDFLDPIIILAIVILNAVLGVFEESKADNAIEALKKMSSPQAEVRRGGKLMTIPSEEVRIGDVLLLKTGDCVSADARLLKAVNLEADESTLTGEAMPAGKESDCVLDEFTPLAERRNMVFASTCIIQGKAEAIVTAIGMDTEMGRIADMLTSEAEEPTPLQKKLAETGKYLGIGALAICAVIFVMGLLKNMPPFSMFLTSVSLAVAAIPEGLPAIVTVVLAMGVQRMAKKKSIVKQLSAVESLGGATVICADKTGTLTQNRMTVTESVAEDKLQLFEMASLCCDGTANPTEAAILNEAKRLGISDVQGHSRICELPFDSKRKLMSVMVMYYGKRRIITKGAAEILLKKCTHCIENGAMCELTEPKRRQILADVRRMGEAALRVIGVAYKDTMQSSISESGLVFTGLIGMMDPPRPEVQRSVSECIRAGIKPVMITGDNKITAEAVAQQVGICGKALTGEELAEKSDEEICGYRIFARVTPADKMRIIKAFKKNGDVVAMTGDGVNDAPALKAADIGCSMGMKGTDVAKEASDLVLADDNFATIVAAVREGRGIFENIKKSIQFLLSSNIGEVITIFIGMLFGWEPPLLAIQLLWVNLVTDSLPAIALGLDPVDEGIMLRKPRNPKKSLFADGLWASICVEGGMIGALALLAFSIGHNLFDMGTSPQIARTMAFCVLSMSQLFHAFNMRSEGSVLNKEFFRNPMLLVSLAAGILMQACVVNISVLAKLFKVTPLTGTQWVIVAVLSVLPIVIVELQKAVSKRMEK
ncbi:MAG: calcium-translocating P-type ATPase, PMCA-type [Clostridia bacterium]|nr:calcium-translocating P-type ATPase, PMCA-type [Clostridia bacterium]